MIKGFAKVFVFILGVRVTIKGKFPKNGPYIIMANHTSMIDPFLWGTFMKGKFTGIVANKNMNYPIYGWILKRMRAVAIDRSNRTESIQRIKNAGDQGSQSGHQRGWGPNQLWEDSPNSSGE